MDEMAYWEERGAREAWNETASELRAELNGWRSRALAAEASGGEGVQSIAASFASIAESLARIADALESADARAETAAVWGAS